jgi:hypothetical protein
MGVDKKSISGLQEIMDYLQELAMMDSTGIIRPTTEKKLGIKFRFGRTRFEEKPYAFQLVDISEYGLCRLGDFRRLKIEVLGHSKRINFESQLLKVGSRSIWLALPTAVIESERRIRQRFSTTRDNMLFFNPKSWTVDGSDIAAPPIFGLYKPLASWTSVVDVSFGGVCVETRFPALLNWIEANPVCEQSELIIPMVGPCQVATELRWSKRIRERISNEDISIAIQKYRFGLKFMEPSSELLDHVGDFIKKLQMDEAC